MHKLICLIFAMLPTCAHAQTFPTIPANTAVGRLGIGPGPAQAIPFATLANQFSSYTTPVTISPPTADTIALTLTTPANYGYGLVTTGTLTGTLTATQYFHNRFYTVNNADARSNNVGGVYGVQFLMDCGTSTQQGSCVGTTHELRLTDTPATGVGNTNRDYVALFAYSSIGASVGGSSGAGNGKGQFWGINTGTAMTVAAQHLSGMIGIEIDINGVTGGSVENKAGLLIAQNTASDVVGSVSDIAISIANGILGAPGWTNGIAFSQVDGVSSRPLSATGTFIASRGNTFPVAAIINFQSISSVDATGCGATCFFLIGPNNTTIVTGEGKATFAQSVWGSSIGAGRDPSATAAFLVVGASVTGAANFNLPATGVAPSSPNNGDFWFDGTDFNVRVGGTTRPFATTTGTQTLTNKTLSASVADGTWTASGTWTIPAVTLGGAVSGGGQAISNVVSVQASSHMQITAVAVASLPTCNSGAEGTRASVNNSNAASFTAGIGAVVAGGGTTKVPVYCDGTNWRIG